MGDSVQTTVIMKVVIYARVSTEDQNVEQQAKLLREWCKNNHHEIVWTIKDKESGKLPLSKRQRFMKIITKEYAFLKDADAVLVYNLDRLTRNWDDVTMIEKFFRDNWDDLMLVSRSDEVNLFNAAGRMMFRIKMAVNCHMPEDMLEKQRVGIERAKKEGKYKGGAKGRTWKLS